MIEASVNRMEELQERLMEYEAANSRVWQTLKAVFPIGAKVFVTQANLRSLIGRVESYVVDAPDRLVIAFESHPTSVVFLSRIRLVEA
jgi:hypothetical protein